MVAGFTFSTDGDVSGLHSGSDPICYRDLWVVKLNPVGIIEWEKSLGGIATEDAFSIIQTSDGGYAIVGISGSLTGDVSGAHGDTLIKHSMSRDSLYTNNYDLWFVKLDSFGSIEW